MVAGLTPASNAARMTFTCPGGIAVARFLALAPAEGERAGAFSVCERGGGDGPSSVARPRRRASSVTARNSLSS